MIMLKVIFAALLAAALDANAASTITRYCAAARGDEILLTEPEQRYQYHYWYQHNRRSETGSFEYIGKGTVRFKSGSDGSAAVAVSGMGAATKSPERLRFSFKNARRESVTVDFLKRQCAGFP